MLACICYVRATGYGVRAFNKEFDPDYRVNIAEKKAVCCGDHVQGPRGGCAWIVRSSKPGVPGARVKPEGLTWSASLLRED